mmetsp:Transcript_24032/g.39748  ORF Transcript_24032/g.39748 Transcript_24032/m.39748 type:complete len:772 (+) Transcript_24032:52-2367(+)
MAEVAEVAPLPPFLEEAVRTAKDEADPCMYEDKDSDKAPAASLKSFFQGRKTYRTMIKLAKKRRRTAKGSTATTEGGKIPPRFTFDKGGVSFAASSIGHEVDISSGSLITVPVFDDSKNVGTARGATDIKIFGSGRGSKGSRNYYGLSKALQDAASVGSRGSAAKYQKSFQDPPAAVLPQGFQFRTPVIMNQSQAFEQSQSQLPQVEENKGLLSSLQRETKLDDYVKKIGNTRFISDDENANGTLLYRKPHELIRGDLELPRDDSEGSTNEFLNWYIRAERNVKRRKYAAGGTFIALMAMAVTLVVLLTGGISASSDVPYMAGSSGDRPMPPQPLPPSPPDFNPDNVSLVAPSGKTWKADTLKPMLEAFSHSSNLGDDGAPQGQAYNWLVNSNLDNMNSGRVQQRYILAVFYFSFHLKSWKNEARWLSSEHECTWFGIKCGSDGSLSFPVEGANRRTVEEVDVSNINDPETFGSGGKFADQVSYINLGENNLHGKLPEELKYLGSLVQLILSENFIGGSIPEGLFAGFQQLHTLYLDNNFMTGQVPDKFNHMDFLRFLDLSGNSFEGPIPGTFQFADDLVDVRLNNNVFSGEIPNAFSKISNLSVFMAGSNEIEGSIPASLSNAANLVTLLLHENELKGSIPDFSSTKLKQLHLDSNALTGGIPSLRAFTSTSLEEMRLEGNKLTGPVPVEIGDHTRLKVLWLNGNQLDGTIPHELGRLEEMTSLQLDGNLLKGSIPDSICALKADHALSSLRATCSGTNPDLECACCDSC